MKHIQAFIFIALLLVGIGATTPVYATSEEPIPSGKVRIKIIRSTEMRAMGVNARLKINTESVASLTRGQEYVGEFNAGEIVLLVDSFGTNDHIVSFKAEEGYQYSLEIVANSHAGPGGLIPFMIFRSMVGEPEESGIEKYKLDAKILAGEKDSVFSFIFREVTNVSSQNKKIEPNQNLGDPVQNKASGLEKEGKLLELKGLYEKGLIDKDMYIERQRDILK